MGRRCKEHKRCRTFPSGLLLVLHWALAVWAQPIEIDRTVVEDFNDIVTKTDGRFNDFGGSIGTINKDDLSYGRTRLVCREDESCSLEFSWDFTVDNDPGAFSGDPGLWRVGNN